MMRYSVVNLNNCDCVAEAVMNTSCGVLSAASCPPQRRLFTRPVDVSVKDLSVVLLQTHSLWRLCAHVL